MHTPSVSAGFEDRFPLARYSFYAHGRVQLLLGVRAEILSTLDSAWEDDQTLRVDQLIRAESLAWLWILGAYEVVRTMSQAKQCFSGRAQEKLASLKRALSKVRMPSAKMERQGRYAAVPSARSPAGLAEPRNLLIGDPDQPVPLRQLLDHFEIVFSSIELSDVLTSHESAYPAGAT